MGKCFAYRTLASIDTFIDIQDINFKTQISKLKTKTQISKLNNLEFDLRFFVNLLFSCGTFTDLLLFIHFINCLFTYPITAIWLGEKTAVFIHNSYFIIPNSYFHSMVSNPSINFIISQRY